MYLRIGDNEFLIFNIKIFLLVRLPIIRFFSLDWQREDEERFEALAIPKSACRLISSAYHSFRVSVDKKFSPNVFNRELIFSFFFTCAELAVVSRQKDKENRVRFFIGQQCYDLYNQTLHSINKE